VCDKGVIKVAFIDVIKENAKIADVSWWTKFAFHYTDITNAFSILDSGLLLSRIEAQTEGKMKNDNASRQVINMTNNEVQSYVRFYFRPLTPTQYYNEGYKHPLLRFSGDIQSNTPVPIFFAFDLEKLLSHEETRFSELSQAGHGASTFSGLDDFKKLNFKKIYSKHYVEDEDRKYRHAELLYPKQYDINDSLKAILCRNEVERTSLLSLLRRNNPNAFYNYKDLIKVCKEDMFEKNGLFIDSIVYDSNSIIIYFFDSFAKWSYDRKQIKNNNIELPISVKVVVNFEWRNLKSTLYRAVVTTNKDYLNAGSLKIDDIPQIKGAKKLGVEIKIDNQLLGYVEYDLTDVI
jgi:hypothetical protein